jgi:hypothetical protein
MDKLLFWLGLGAAQKGAGSKPTPIGRSANNEAALKIWSSPGGALPWVALTS